MNLKTKRFFKLQDTNCDSNMDRVEMKMVRIAGVIQTLGTTGGWKGPLDAHTDETRDDEGL